MKPLMLSLIALTLFTFSGAAQADRFGHHHGDRFGRRFQWIGSRCGEFTPQGVLIRYVDERFCPRTYFDWIGSRCGEFTPQGVLIRYADERFCPRTYFDWIGSRCGEFTPNGVLIRYADEWRCRRH